MNTRATAVVLSLLYSVSFSAWADKPSHRDQDATCVVNSASPIRGQIRETAAYLEKVANTKCFDPEKNESIKKYYTANLIYPDKACKLHETNDRIHRMHQTIMKRSKEMHIDPRILYIRMLGESAGQPFVQYNPDKNAKKCPDANATDDKKEIESFLNGVSVSEKRAFGLFQFLGRSYGAKDFYANEVMKLEKENEKLTADKQKGMREIQVEYFFDSYLSKYAKYSYGTKCGPEALKKMNAANEKIKTEAKKNKTTPVLETKEKDAFKYFTDLQKLSYLGVGDCTKTAHTEEVIMNNASYKSSGAKDIYLGMKMGIPVCETK